MNSQDAIEQLKAKIIERRPVLGRLFEETSKLSLRQYVNSLSEMFSQPLPERKQQFLKAISKEAGKYFPSEIVKNLVGQIANEYMVSTAEHHGPLTHPFFAHSNLLASQLAQKDLVILAVGNVSLNNSSYPRGVLFHTPEGTRHQLPFFPASERMSPVYGHRAYTLKDLVRAQRLLEAMPGLPDKLRKAISDLISEVYGSAKVLALPDYNHQIVVTNHRLWQRLLRDSPVKVGSLITLQIENVVLDLLAEHHIFVDTDFHRLIFDPNIHQKTVKFADGLPGNFSLAEKKGTFLFWLLPSGSSERQQLRLKNGCLVSEAGYNLALEPSAVAAAIERGELIPNTCLSLLLLSKYYGVKCLGGFSQGTYLTLMHEAFNKIFERDDTENVKHTTGLRSDFVLAHYVISGGLWKGATGIDLALHATRNSWLVFLDNINKLTLEEAMAPLFPELYLILYGQAERLPDLTALTDDDIIKHYDLTQKLKPVVAIND